MLHPHKCLNCGEPLHGRIDKKFCSDQCRATHNNRSKKPHEQNIKKLNMQLRKNRTILKTLCPLGKATVRREVLEQMGFSYRHFTSIYGTRANTYFLVYDYAFMPKIEKSITKHTLVQKVVIVQQQDFMRKFDPWNYL